MNEKVLACCHHMPVQAIRRISRCVGSKEALTSYHVLIVDRQQLEVAEGTLLL